jgi:hypothetical protein
MIDSKYNIFSHLQNRDGLAMITVILFLVFMLVIGGLVMYVMTRGIQATGSARRYYTAFEAAESGIEWGMVRIEEVTRTGATLTGDTLSLDAKDVEVQLFSLFSSPVSGSGMGFGSGYDGIGRGAAGGGSSVNYRIDSNATGEQKSNVTIEVAYRKIIGVEAR